MKILKEKKKITIQCETCKGTGIYVGFAERDGLGVVCNNCYGHGWKSFKYEEFTGKVKRDDVKKVLERNPGFCVGGSDDCGGMPYSDWFKGKPFPPGSEVRKYSCPHWWTCQVFELPECTQECNLGRKFSECGRFPMKHECWEKYDQVKKEKNNE